MGVSAGHARSRLATFAFFCVLSLFVYCFVLSGGQPAHAQEAGGDEPAEKEKKDDKGGAGAHPKPKLLTHMMESAGPIFGPLLLAISIGLVTVIVLLAMDLRMSTSIPPYFVEEFTDTVNKRRFKEAFEMARNDTSFLGRVLSAGMGRLQYGIEDSREASLNMVESVKASKEQLIAYLATAGTLGPMIGLVGTVFGMIQSFMVLSIPGTTPKPQDLAKGISHALVVTLLGIGLSVPAIFCHTLFRNRLIRISMDVSNISDDLLTQMYHNSKKPAPPGPTGAPTPAVGNNAQSPAAVTPAK